MPNKKNVTKSPVAEDPIVAGSDSAGVDAVKEDEGESDCHFRVGGSLNNSPHNISSNLVYNAQGSLENFPENGQVVHMPDGR